MDGDSKAVGPSQSVMNPVDVEMDGRDSGKQTAAKQKNTENGKHDDSIDKEKHDADDNTEVSADKEPADLLPSPLPPVPFPKVEDQPPSEPALPDPHAKRDDSHHAGEDKNKEREGENQASSLDEVPAGKQPSETRSSGLAGAASIRTELQLEDTQPKSTATKTRKHPDTQIDDGLIVTQTKRLRLGPAPKEILTLAERAELDKGTIAAPKGPKRRVRKT